MSQPKTKSAVRAAAALVTLGALLAGCSDIYLDRRETVSLGAEDESQPRQPCRALPTAVTIVSIAEFKPDCSLRPFRGVLFRSNHSA